MDVPQDRSSIDDIIILKKEADELEVEQIMTLLEIKKMSKSLLGSIFMKHLMKKGVKNEDALRKVHEKIRELERVC